MEQPERSLEVGKIAEQNLRLLRVGSVAIPNEQQQTVKWEASL